VGARGSGEKSWGRGRLAGMPFMVRIIASDVMLLTEAPRTVSPDFTK
jgi:hypothetical protein